MIINCDFCGKEFEKPINKVNESRKNGWSLYCSPECRGKSKKIRCICSKCGKEVWKTPSEIKKSKTGNVFCSKSCACSYNNSHFRTKENNPNWRGGKMGSQKYLKNAYRAYRKKCTICGCEDPNVLEVHHIDCNRGNDDVDNLIILCANCHTRIHRGGFIITDKIKDNREILAGSNPAI